MHFFLISPYQPMRLCIKYVDSFTLMYILPKTAKRFLSFQLSLLVPMSPIFKLSFSFLDTQLFNCLIQFLRVLFLFITIQITFLTGLIFQSLVVPTYFPTSQVYFRFVTVLPFSQINQCLSQFQFSFCNFLQNLLTVPMQTTFIWDFHTFSFQPLICLHRAVFLL